MAIFHLLTAALLFILLTAFGFSLLDRFSFQYRGFAEKWGMCFLVGFGLTGYLIFGFGLLGVLNGWFFAAIFILAAFLLRHSLFGLGHEAFAVFRLPRPPLTYFHYAVAAVLILGAVQCLAPPTAHDALAYHLDIPKQFFQMGEIAYIPYGVNSIFPLLMHMYYLLALLWHAPVLANLFHLLMAIAVVFGILSLEKRGAEGKILGLSALIYILTPGVFNQMSIAATDIALSAFLFYFFLCVIKWDETGEEKWCYLGAILLGFALSVKYLAGIGAVIFALFIGYKVLSKEKPPKEAVFLLAKVGLIAFIVSFVWYARSYYFEGSFLYFGEVGYAPRGHGGWTQKLLLPWMMTMEPERFGGSWAQVGPVYLAFFPAILAGMRGKDRWLRLSVFFTAVYFTAWVFLPRQNLRFLFPILPFACVFLARGFQNLPGSKLFQNSLRLFLAVFLLLYLVMAVYHGRSEYPAVLGLQSRDTYLKSKERTMGISEFINREIPQSSKILNAYEVRMFYFERQMVREPEYRAKTAYDRLESDLAVLHRIRGDQFTHVLIARPAKEQPVLTGQNIEAVITKAAKSGSGVKLVFETVSSGAGEEPVRYQLYEFSPN